MRLTRKTGKWFTSYLTILVCLLAACGSPVTPGATPTTAHPKAPGAQQIYLSGNLWGSLKFGSIDPQLAQTGLDLTAVWDLFVGMVQLNDQGFAYCELCSSYSVASNGVTWTFNLRTGLKFSDGTPLTSADVVYSINRALDPATQSGTGPYYLRYIKDATAFADGSKSITTLIGDSLLAPDTQTVKIITVSPVAFFLDSLTYPTSYVVEQSVVKKWGKAWTDHLTDNGGQGGAGPWKVQEYTPGKQFVVVPNPNYWGPQPQFRKIVYPFFQQPESTYPLYLVNKLDNSVIPTVDIDRARTRTDFHQVPTLSIDYYTMNYAIKPFDVVACRQAFALAINKTSIVQSVFKGTALPTNHIVPQGMYGYDASLTGPDGTTSTSGNPTQARSDLLACMTTQGYTSISQMPPITLSYYSGGDQTGRNEEEALRQDWQDTLGISVTLNDIGIKMLGADLSFGCGANPLQFWDNGTYIADYPDPQDFTTLVFDKGSPNNSMCYGQNKGPGASEQQQVQAELEAADLNTNPTARLAAYHQAEQALVNDVAWLPMDQGLNLFLRKPCVQGWTDTSLGLIPPQDWSKVYISTDRPCAITS